MLHRMRQIASLPVSFQEANLQGTPLRFDEAQQRLVIADNLVAVYEDGFKICEQSKLNELLKIGEEHEIQETREEMKTLMQASEWRFDDSVEIPGPEILQNVAVITDSICFYFKRASKMLYYNKKGEGPLSGEFEAQEPIYQVIVLRRDEDNYVIALTADRFPNGIYGAKSKVVNGHLLMLQLDNPASDSECNRSEGLSGEEREECSSHTQVESEMVLDDAPEEQQIDRREYIVGNADPNTYALEGNEENAKLPRPRKTAKAGAKKSRNPYSLKIDKLLALYINEVKNQSRVDVLKEIRQMIALLK